MKNRQAGVLPTSDIYLYQPSLFAKKALLFAEMSGSYQCESGYDIDRNYIDIYMVFWIKSGYMYFETEHDEFVASDNTIVVLDCHKPHRFYAREKVDFNWMHINGKVCKDFYNLLKEQDRLVISYPHEPDCAPFFKSIIKNMDNKPDKINEMQISVNIHQIFSSLVQKEVSEHETVEPYIKNAVTYIDNNYRDDLSVEDIAKQAGLSLNYFSKCFKSSIGVSPYQYIINNRIRNAKKLLIETNDSIDHISLNCGFNNTSNFIRAFKINTEMTPSQFRRLRS